MFVFAFGEWLAVLETQENKTLGMTCYRCQASDGGKLDIYACEVGAVCAE